MSIISGIAILPTIANHCNFNCGNMAVFKMKIINCSQIVIDTGNSICFN